MQLLHSQQVVSQLHQYHSQGQELLYQLIFLKNREGKLYLRNYL